MVAAEFIKLRIEDHEVAEADGGGSVPPPQRNARPFFLPALGVLVEFWDGPSSVAAGGDGSVDVGSVVVGPCCILF